MIKRLNKEDKIIISDVDGVSLDYLSGLDRYMVLNGIKVNYDSHSYDLTKRYGLEFKTLHEYMHRFHHDDFIAKLNPMADALEHIKHISNDGYKFIWITSIEVSDFTMAARKSNLLDVFGDVTHSIYFTDMDQPKTDILSALGQDTGLLWVEDKYENAVDGHSVGLKTILVDAPHNTEYVNNDLIRVCERNTWKEIREILDE